MPQDYYDTLGVPRNATDDEIKAAYRRLAMKHHPDRNPGSHEAEEKFKELNSAYEALSDPQKRSVYDQFGHAGVNQAGGFGGGFGGGFAGADLNDVFSSMFESVFTGGTGSGRQRSRRGSDLKYETEITLEEAFSGGQTQVNYERTERCQECGGSGSKSGHKLKKCPACRGAGRIQYAQGFFSLSQTCPECAGQGEIIEHPCPSCSGAGRVRRKAHLSIRIPPGVETGTVLKASGAGDAGPRDGLAGDLYVQIRVKDHAKFERDGDDLLYKCPINFPQAALGCEVEVPLVGGEKIQVKVPDGTQHGALLRLREKGMPRLVSPKHYGDMLVQISVAIPRHLSEKEKQLLTELAAAMDAEAQKEPGFFKKVFGK